MIELYPLEAANFYSTSVGRSMAIPERGVHTISNSPFWLPVGASAPLSNPNQASYIKGLDGVRALVILLLWAEHNINI